MRCFCTEEQRIPYILKILEPLPNPTPPVHLSQAHTTAHRQQWKEMSGEAAFLEAFKRSSSSSSSSSSSDEDSSPKAKAKAKGRKVATKKTEKFDLFGDIFSASPSPKPSPGRKRKLIKPGQGGGGSKPPAGPVLVVSSDESDKENSEELDVFVTQPHKKKARAEIDLTLNSPKNMLDLTASVDSQSAKKSKWKKKIQVVGSEEEEEDEDEDKIKLDFSAEDTDDDYVSS